MASSTYQTSAQFSRLMALREKRNELKGRIRKLKSRASVGFYLRQLQKQNLLMKDEIYALENVVANTSMAS